MISDSLSVTARANSFLPSAPRMLRKRSAVGDGRGPCARAGSKPLQSRSATKSSRGKILREGATGLRAFLVRQKAWRAGRFCSSPAPTVWFRYYISNLKTEKRRKGHLLHSV